MLPTLYRICFTLTTFAVAAEALGAGRKWR
jgi:hypothetical protein